MRYLHDCFGVVIATSDSHAGEYYREAVEHATPKDFLAARSGSAAWSTASPTRSSPRHGRSRRLLQWETSEPLQPILRAAITGEPERIASAILPNDDLVPSFPPTAAVEVSAVASGDGIKGDRTDDLPLAFTAKLRQEVAIQQLVADAAILGSRDAAHQALLIDPVVGSSRAAEAISPTSRPRTPTSGRHLPDEREALE